MPYGIESPPGALQEIWTVLLVTALVVFFLAALATWRERRRAAGREACAVRDDDAV